MNKLISLLICVLLSLTASAQEDPTLIGYKLNASSEVIRIYRNINGKPDTTIWNKWNQKYWFKLDTAANGVYVNPNTHVSYLRITIEADSRYDDMKRRSDSLLINSHKNGNSAALSEAKLRYSADNYWTTMPGYNVLVPWKTGEYIDGSDFNTWLWIKKNDFRLYKKNYYTKIYGRLIFSGLTVPFKYHPSTSSQSNSMISGDINIGTFVGVRFSLGGKGGISAGGSLGVTSLSQSAATNTTLTGDKTETLQGFNYGVGIVFDWQKKFQLGGIIGWDYGLGNLAKTYIYQQKSWFSLSLNYNFLSLFKENVDANKTKVEVNEKKKWYDK